MNFSSQHVVAACGLIAISASAMADSGVTIYGRIDTSMALTKVGDVRIDRMVNGGSHLGFRGTESLGNGLEVGFQLESAFDSDTGAGAEAAFGNRSELFLSNSAGTLRFGRFLNPSYYAVADRVSLHNEDFGITADMLYAYMGHDTNRIAYKSPLLSGLTLEASVALHERQYGDARDKNATDLVASYERDNWSVAVTYGKQGAAQQYGLRGTWSSGAWTVSAYHQRSQYWDAKNYEVDRADGKRNVTRAAVAYAIGAGELQANFGHANGKGQQQARQWTLGYNHHLSKRTKLYAFYTTLQNKGGASYGLPEMTANQDFKAVNVGIRHHF